MDGHVEDWLDNPNVFFMTALSNLNTPYSCEEWGDFGIPGLPVIVEDTGWIRLWFTDNSGFPYHAVLDHEMRVVAKPRPYGNTDALIQQLLDDCLPCNSTDFDEDGVDNLFDNCPDDYNPDQVDSDDDGLGDVCDDCTNLTGDINDDIVLDVLDIVIMVDMILHGGYAADGYTDCQKQDADINNDQTINVLDIVMLVSLILE